MIKKDAHVLTMHGSWFPSETPTNLQHGNAASSPSASAMEAR